jgi:predicted amidophosphoribosyltransferase
MCRRAAPAYSRAIAYGAFEGAHKLWQRGFSRSELIARAALKRQPLAGTLNKKSLVRQRETMPQAGLTRQQRRENFRGAFVVRAPEAVRGRDILWVDDVFTTGTTMSECARVLRRAGAASVYAATVARTLKAGPNADRIGMEGEVERAA